MSRTASPRGMVRGLASADGCGVDEDASGIGPQQSTGPSTSSPVGFMLINSARTLFSMERSDTPIWAGTTPPSCCLVSHTRSFTSDLVMVHVLVNVIQYSCQRHAGLPHSAHSNTSRPTRLAAAPGWAGTPHSQSLRPIRAAVASWRVRRHSLPPDMLRRNRTNCVFTTGTTHKAPESWVSTHSRGEGAVSRVATDSRGEWQRQNTALRGTMTVRASAQGA